MAAEQVLELFDSYWFETTVLPKKTPSPSPSPFPSTHNTSPQQAVIGSFSDQTLASTSLSFSSQTSPPKLPRGLSGKEVAEEFPEETIKKKAGHRIRRGRRGPTRSLSDLEIKELKGFMDLGFVFSEEDKDSSRLVSLIPGLQRMGRRRGEEEEEEEDDDDESVICRPYLSEAWGVLDRRKVGKENPLLLNLRVPSSQGSSSTEEIDMKHNLRFWAHSVASIVT